MYYCSSCSRQEWWEPGMEGGRIVCEKCYSTTWISEGEYQEQEKLRKERKEAERKEAERKEAERKEAERKEAERNV